MNETLSNTCSDHAFHLQRTHPDAAPPQARDHRQDTAGRRTGAEPLAGCGAEHPLQHMTCSHNVLEPLAGCGAESCYCFLALLSFSLR